MKQTMRPGGVLMIKLAPGDLKSPQDLYENFEELIIGQEIKRILVDLDDIDDATSLMIGTLISLHLLAYEHLSVLKFTNLQPKIQMLFRMLGVQKVLESHYGRDEATDTFGAVGGPPGFAE